MKNAAILRVALGLISLVAAAPVEPVVHTVDSPEIVGGPTVSSATTFHFIANLQESGSFICGGTILSTTKILTAAHCAVDGSASTFKFRVSGDPSSNSCLQSRRVFTTSSHSFLCNARCLRQPQV